MPSATGRTRLLAAFVVLAAAACTTSDTGAPTEPQFGKAGIDCLPGCQEEEDDTDPNYLQPGIFLTSAVTNTTCFSGTGTDTDQDGLPDRCERDIAAAFAPQLAITGSDRTGREPHWAAKSYPSSGIVRVAYLLSYYTDDGPSTNWCNNNIVDIVDREACHGHFGDSEVIVLDVYYNTSTKHWVLDCATYSAHESYNLKCRGTSTYPTSIFYPGKKGGYPRAYVSYQKHANYFDDASCDSGSKLGSDTCAASRYERVAAGGNLDIGSSRVHSVYQDCVASTNPLYQPIGKKECYWTGLRFGGWQTGQPDSKPNKDRLYAFGFFK